MFTVRVKFTKNSPYYRVGVKEQTYENITEIHYKHPPSRDSVALESDIDRTGYVLTLEWVEEFEAIVT